jgi:hypothetical protein
MICERYTPGIWVILMMLWIKAFSGQQYEGAYREVTGKRKKL